MSINCQFCGESNSIKEKFCHSCGGQLQQIKVQEYSKTFNTLAIISLVIGVLCLALVLWFPDTLLMNLDFFIDYYAGRYQDRDLVIVIVRAVYVLLSIIGVVLGAISIKGGKRIIALVGTIINSTVILLALWRLVMYIFVAFIV